MLGKKYPFSSDGFPYRSQQFRNQEVLAWHAITPRPNTLQSNYGQQRPWFADSKFRQSAILLHLRSKHSRQCLCFCLEVQVRGLAAYRPQFSDWHNRPSCVCASHKIFLYLCIAHCQDICIWSYPMCCFCFHTHVSFFASFAMQCMIYIQFICVQ